MDDDLRHDRSDIFPHPPSVFVRANVLLLQWLRQQAHPPADGAADADPAADNADAPDG